MCGENKLSSIAAQYFLGSPPRVRGKLARFLDSNVAVRITPACAGKTNRGKRLPLFPQDHPRVCGENFSV